MSETDHSHLTELMRFYNAAKGKLGEIDNKNARGTCMLIKPNNFWKKLEQYIKPATSAKNDSLLKGASGENINAAPHSVGEQAK
jgi:hypothetical protein